MDCECYFLALSLALTLPNIGGQVEYPNEKKLGKDTKIGLINMQKIIGTIRKIKVVSKTIQVNCVMLV